LSTSFNKSIVIGVNVTDSNRTIRKRVTKNIACLSAHLRGHAPFKADGRVPSNVILPLSVIQLQLKYPYY